MRINDQREELPTTRNCNDSSSSEIRESKFKNYCCIKENPFVWFLHRTKEIWWHQLSCAEISGSLGDLGTFIPLTVALARQRSILLAPALFWAGWANIVTGYLWDVPMCVQPMKSIAAVALSENLSQAEVSAAGLWMGGFMVLLGVTQLIELVNIIVPAPVVAGLQVGVGLRLASKGIVTVADLEWWGSLNCIALGLVLALCCMYWLRDKSKRTKIEDDEDNNDEDNSITEKLQTDQSSIELITKVENDSNVINTKEPEEQQQAKSLWTKVTKLFNCCFSRREQHPVGIYLFLIGSIFAIITLTNSPQDYDLPLRFFGAPVATWVISDIRWEDYKVGLLEGAIPQLPLTTLNSVISVCCLAHALYPEKRIGNRDDAVVSRREVSISVGLMNLLLCPFGGMPNCHGAGGLAGQHRFGARHGASVVFLGVAKICLAVFFGASVLTLLDAFPSAVLGVMLTIAGQELATTGITLLLTKSAEYDRDNIVIAIVTAMVIVALGKTHIGALSGWVVYMIYGNGAQTFWHWIQKRRRKRRLKNNEAGNYGDREARSGVPL
mmetsp:Transcript_26029/g.38475  ORF Transcript_26029/g.38475 Transcript_26029/m.38475 type:complete len:553 (-) Transcript_26029:67-1725(-)|eukprot:CAMPEP_0194200484 /NCGR_PEP_ID=MMETSP0156-20130528/1067_1 /TAXON_ID=33649 /ORGANISM="Thalassionema nitzschioides, Strain L26-B" /LENGTH=552 /DNA_ID=CAMNT_0038925485 /DNA_START=108 /DNA_END=1766 /DNA_ORIENTATION=+